MVVKIKATGELKVNDSPGVVKKNDGTETNLQIEVLSFQVRK